jgi:hypothetical protein
MTDHWSKRAPWQGLIRVTIVPVMAITLCPILPVMFAVAPFFIVCAFLEIRIGGLQYETPPTRKTRLASA